MVHLILKYLIRLYEKEKVVPFEVAQKILLKIIFLLPTAANHRLAKTREYAFLEDIS